MGSRKYESVLKKRIDVPFELKQLSEDETGKFFEFSGFAATFGNVDRGNDRIIKGAFIDSIKDLRSRAVDIPDTQFKALMPILWQHRHDKPIGSFVEMREDDRGLFVKGIMPKESTFVREEVLPQMRVRSVSDMSIGFLIKERTIDSEDVFNLEKVELFETSLVTIPMNTEANITEFKGTVIPFGDLPLASKEHEWDIGAAISRVKRFTNSLDQPSLEYKRDFFYYDPDIADEFDSYKLPFADVIDGKLVAIPKGIFAVAAVLRGARGHVDIDESKRDDVEAVVTRYYDKMGLESPFSKSYILGVNEADSLTHREFEKFLFASGIVSKEGAKLLASKFKPIVRDADGKSSVRDAAHSKIDNILNLLKEGD